MSISGLSNLFQTQNTEEIRGLQRKAEDPKSASFSPKADSVTISAEAYRMAQALRENNASPNTEQKGDQSGTNSGLTNEANSSNAENAADISIPKNGVLEGARALPHNIRASSEKNLANIIDKGTKVLFEFGEGGSISIKPGLLREDYLRAHTTLRAWEIHEPGLGF